ncbi:MAG: asparagine synthase C-terminal domain-containing protein [Proteobacteria bacterium]|nr:asparagine synthase C-terminal domain-containing protein [Pseudomonadota bacterium]
MAGLLAGRGGRRTFTIGFDADGYDESGYARIAARHFGTVHHEYFVTPKDVCESLPSIASSYGEPFGNSSVIPTFHCARFAREHGIETMLAGDGGDELFAGNTRYVDQNVFERYFKVPAVLRGFLELGYRLLPVLSRLPVAGKGARYIEQAKMGLPDRLQSYNFLNRFDPHSVFESDWLGAIDRQAPWQAWRARYQAPREADALQRMLYLDWKFTLADNDLVKVSRMCDLAGVEVCYPMLDTAVLELSTAISSATLLEGGRLRGFYKSAFDSFLPGEIITKKKHGFGLPFGVWMRNDLGLQALVADAFAGMRKRAIFAPRFLDDALRLFREDAAGYYGELVWIVTMLEMWLASHE